MSVSGETGILMCCRGYTAVLLFNSILFLIISFHYRDFSGYHLKLSQSGAGHHLLQSFKHIHNISYVEF